MEIVLKKNILTFKHKLKKNETYRIDNRGNIKTISIYPKPQVVSGFSNSTEDLRYIVTLDYDHVSLSVVLEDYNKIQEKYKLPQGYLFTTKKEEIGNFHVICLAKLSYVIIQKLLSETRCDQSYISMNSRNPYRNWVLRLSKKSNKDRPIFFGLIGKNINLDRNISTAHKKLLSKLYSSIIHPNYSNEDNLNMVAKHKYETRA